MKRTRRSATKVVARHLCGGVVRFAAGNEKPRESSLDFRRNQFRLSVFVRERPTHSLSLCVCMPARFFVCARKAHPRTLRSRVFNAFVAL